jgi:hypothetical protein
VNALLRYAVIKGMREHFIPTLLFAPSIMFVTPLFALCAWNMVRGRAFWPPTLAPNLTADASGAILAIPGLLFSIVIAAMAAFWVLRTEITGRTVGFFFLAHSPMSITLSVTLFGVVMALLSYAVTIALLSIVTGYAAAGVVSFLLPATVGFILGASLGTLLVGVSPESSTLVPGLVVSGLAGIWMLETKSPMLMSAALAVAVVAILITPLVWRRRCAV